VSARERVGVARERPIERTARSDSPLKVSSVQRHILSPASAASPI
jgi:hypothetical protein